MLFNFENLVDWIIINVIEKKFMMQLKIKMVCVCLQ